jgi:hypothetical protein
MEIKVGFSDRFLSALGRWQKGWREDATLRLEFARELETAIEETGLSVQFRTVNETCYRKRFLIPNNPQNGGGFWPIIPKWFPSRRCSELDYREKVRTRV